MISRSSPKKGEFPWVKCDLLASGSFSSLMHLNKQLSVRSGMAEQPSLVFNQLVSNEEEG